MIRFHGKFKLGKFGLVKFQTPRASNLAGFGAFFFED